MKYGLLLYKDTDNLGDDIQSYAAMKFLPQVDYIIDREAMDEFIPDKKEYVTTIMNGWYLHKKYHFPFSPYIHPLLLSMHFTENDLITKRGYQFLDGYTKDFLSQFGKIGCRDHGTEEMLKEKGYDTYFSGCMTLTIDKIGKKKTGNYICVIDMKDEIIDKVRELFPEMEIKVMSHWIVPEEISKLSLEERMKQVEDYLTIYQNARMLITDRLHCALPAIALETPVALIFYEHNADRLTTFKDYVTHYSEGQFLEITREELLKVKNPDYYKKIRNSLKKRVKKFVEESKTISLDINQLPEVSWYQDSVQRMNHMETLFLEQIEHLKKQKEEGIKREKELYEKIVSLDKEVARLYPYEQQLLEMDFSRSFKLYKKYYDRRQGVNKKLPRGGVFK